MTVPTDRKSPFIARLERLAVEENRTALAALRRGLGKKPGEVSDPSPYIDPYLSPKASRRDVEAYYLVGTLFGLHPASHQGGSGSDRYDLGAAFRVLALRSGSESIERRFIALLNCHRDDLDEHLRHAVALLKTKEIPIDWGQLLRDLIWWDAEGRRVQRSWARSFWRTPLAEEPGEESDSADEETAEPQGRIE